MKWPYKDLLDVDLLTREEVQRIFQTADSFMEINNRSVKKVPTLKGRSVVLFFVEPSTRTKTSFDMAAKRLSADTFSLAKGSSSLTKGETLKDTVQTLQSMKIDAVVIRDPRDGAAKFAAERLNCAVLNAGDGRHAHPTQALLDAYTLRKVWNGEFEGKTLLILGDIAHSRVARSNVHLLTKLGVKVRLCGPRTLLPPRLDSWPVEVFHDVNEAVKGVDAVTTLRLQLERMQDGLLPSLDEYSKLFGIGVKHLELMNPGAKILHPGPINRGVELSSELADHDASIILDQVTSGVAIRMAMLFLLITRND
ncbi:aspartate carbamoyltransferase catalytic subunit [Desulfobaculum bizertense]|uniref:Aspartate carbamoyltransferase n=1 Tax=Desulfobaculum bizertense DSM 18034 TaxID=1121442 RepID=A0A1T4WCC4_9BACT|nr:aspartate carbamoyltransferase catalytic subunit [Desulfobaculum bizertense]UIJ37457.1 aspartate carbamoyltransferase catalytic subunit [Desulfobaculum bizertense]SKA74769.1 aspartate carbamoyltransferase [Desulfobaculum bizertense DSM 18034]